VIARGWAWLVVAGVAVAGPPGLAIVPEVDRSGTTTGVKVVGLPLETLKALADPSWSAGRLTDLFPVSIEVEGPRRTNRPSMLGTYQVEAGAIRFLPRYPFDRGRTYSAIFRPSVVPGGSGPDLALRFAIARVPSAPTSLVRVTPSGDRLPENLLKFYLHFSAPMSRGQAYDRIQLLKEDGRAVDQPFLRIAEELWDHSGTRLTLLVDPGRIKRGLKPREESGPVLEAGRRYTLAVDKGWLDAEGVPLVGGFRKSFLAVEADEGQPDPKTWTVDRPAAESRSPLRIRFPESLDGALVESALTLFGPRGEAVAGMLAIGPGEASWTFTPEAFWPAGIYQLVVDADLEDLAGNSILRPFEVDVRRDTPSRPEAKAIRIPIPIRP